MSQELARCLLAVGSAVDPEGKGEYQLYVDPERSFLSCKLWTGDSFGQQDIIASSVRPNSTAAFLITESTGKLVICITPSSNLSAYTYDDDECEWVESEDHPIASYKVHPDGKLVASKDAKGKVCLFLQNPEQRLVHLDEAWKPTVLPVNPVAGSPMTTLLFEDGLHLYYISANDNYIHDVIQDGGTWRDTIVIKYVFGGEVKAFVMSETESGDESYVLTGEPENALLNVTAGGEMTKLGTVKGGKFVPKTTEEARRVIEWFYPGGGLRQRETWEGARVSSRRRW